MGSKKKKRTTNIKLEAHKNSPLGAIGNGILSLLLTLFSSDRIGQVFVSVCVMIVSVAAIVRIPPNELSEVIKHVINAIFEDQWKIPCIVGLACAIIGIWSAWHYSDKNHETEISYLKKENERLQSEVESKGKKS